MGKLIEGVWHPDADRTVDADGHWHRPDSTIRDHVRTDGSTDHAPAAGRYHLFVAHNCGWSHRCIIARNLKGLRDVVPMHIAHFRRNELGWWFPETSFDDLEIDDGKLALHRFFTKTNAKYTGTATVPILWDSEVRRIVTNESADLLRMFNSEFDSVASGDVAPIDLYPEELRATIDEVNEWVYPSLNNGVYRAGFAGSQKAYETAAAEVFDALDRLEERLASTRFVAGDRLTEADVRVFPTLIRFDSVYYSHFKCNRNRIVDMPNLWGWLRDMYQTPGIGETVEIEIYKKGYYGRSERLNPSGIIPIGPQLDFDSPHDRG